MQQIRIGQMLFISICSIYMQKLSNKKTSVYNDIEAITKGGDLDEEIDEV